MRDYVFEPMNGEHARAVVSWRYEAPYDFYDMAKDPEGVEDLLGPPERRRGYYAVLSDGELVAFFSYGPGGQLPGYDYRDDGSIQRIAVMLAPLPALVNFTLGSGSYHSVLGTRVRLNASIAPHGSMSSQYAVDIGLGLRPDLTGKGLGLEMQITLSCS